MSSGAAETEKLKQNLVEQLERLVKQLADLEEYREVLDPDEYTSTRNETLEQMKEFNHSLQKMTCGNVTLIDEVAALKLALQAAISQAFKTPEVISLFAKKQPAQLRYKLPEIDRQFKLQKISGPVYNERRSEILGALKRLNDPLSLEEEEFLKANCSDEFCKFVIASNIDIDDKIISLIQEK